MTAAEIERQDLIDAQFNVRERLVHMLWDIKLLSDACGIYEGRDRNLEAISAWAASIEDKVIAHLETCRKIANDEIAIEE